MTNAPNPGNKPEPNTSNQPESNVPRNSRRNWQRRLLLIAGLFSLLGIGGGITWGWIFIHRYLAPMVETNIERLLNRPMELGEVERFSLNGLRFGASEIPATRLDPDRVTIEAVDVAYDPLKLLFDRTLELDITLVEPDIYLEQDKKRQWVSSRLQAQEKGRIEVKLNVLRVRDADVVLVSRSQEGKLQEPVVAALPSASTRFLDENQLIKFNLSGRLLRGGNFELQGESRLPEKKTNLVVSGSDLVATEIGRLLQLPLALQAGRIDSNLEVQMQDQQPLKLLGTAQLENVTARVPQLPSPFAYTNGQLRFNGTKVQLENITTLFGQLPAQANGVVDTQSNYNLSARTQPVQLKKVLQTFNVKQLPVAASGAVQAAVQVTGPLAKPIVSGQVNTVTPTLIDRVNFRSIRSSFRIVDSAIAINNLQAIPTVGGSLTANGQIKLGQQGGAIFDVQAQNVPGDAIAKNYRANLPVSIGLVSGRTRIFSSLDNPQNLRATGITTLNVAGGTVTASSVQVIGKRFQAQVRASGVQLGRLAKVPPQFQGPLSGNFNIAGNLANFSPSTIRGSGSGSLNLAGGRVTASNVQLANGRFTAQVRASDVEVGRLAQVPPQFQGPLSGNFNIAGSLANFSPSTISGSGSGSLNLGGGRVTASNVQLANGRFQAQVRASDLQLARLAQVPPALQGAVSGQFNLAGSLANFSPSTIRGSGSGSLRLADGTVTASNVQLAKGRFQAQVRTSSVPLERLAQVPPQFRGALAGNFNIAGSLTSFSPSTITANGSGSLNLAGGIITARTLRLQNGRFQADVEADGVQIERLAQVPPQLRGPVSGEINLSGSLADFSPSTITGSGSGRLNVAGGTVTASNLQLANGRFQATVEPSGVELAAFSPDLQGSVDGRLNVAGSLTAFSPSAIQATGQLAFSEGLSVIDRPLTASIAWNGQQLQIQQATASGFNANGVVNVNLANRGLQAIQGFDLNVQAENLDLNDLPATLPVDVNVAGQADFNGRIAGTVSAPNVNGTLALRDFFVEDLAFQSELRGTVSAVPGQGVNVDLNGINEEIQVALGPDYRPNSFSIQGGGAIASGQRQDNQLLVSVDQFPIDLLQELAPLPPAIALQPLEGNLSGGLNVNLNTYDIALNNLKITGPIFDPPGNDQSPPGNNEYLISGQIIRTAYGPEFKDVNVQIAQGQLPVILAALEAFNVNRGDGDGTVRRGFGTPPDIEQVGVPDGSLQDKLRRLSEIEALLAQLREQREADTFLPDLNNAKGSFTGNVVVNGSLASGISANVRLNGQDWQWGSYSADNVSLIAAGSFNDGVLSLLPLRFESDDGASYANFSGTIGGDAQSGQLQLRNIPIEQLQALLQEFTNLPPTVIGFTGLLNATVTLSGSINDPQARGDLEIVDATINQTKVQSAQGSFSYNNARLNFGSAFVVASSQPQTDAQPPTPAEPLTSAEREPLTITGSIPYKLPFASVQPASNELNLDIDVKNEGLAIIDLLSRRQLAWGGGNGSIDLVINGNFDPQVGRPSQLTAKGTVDLENAIIGAQALPDPLTDVNGTIAFNFDNIEIVDQLSGKYGGGEVIAKGSLPISRAALPGQIDIALGQLALNLKGLYNGGVRGDVQISGSALQPVIAGDVDLFDGRVELAQREGGAAGGGSLAGNADSRSPIEFNNLQLELAEDIQVTQAPILNFLAQGKLTLNGSLDNIQPKGTINLKRGQVNLFTTQFRLARREENTAEFSPERGLDPLLNVQLEASVPETTQRRLPTDPLSAEISDAPITGFGSVQTVRVEANVEGPASRLLEGGGLELTSTPARSETEIVALLGGGFVETLGRGDTTLGLANLAGSALLGSVQNVIGDALGLSEFRLYPTIISNDEEREESSSLGLTAEAGIDIGRDFSVSVLKELTTEQPFQYSLRYRLNNELLLRGATDLSGEGRATIEYETRF